MRGVPVVPIGTDGMRLRNKNKLDCSCHQALPIEPLSDPDLVYFVLFVVNFFLRGEKVFVSVRERLRPSAAKILLWSCCLCGFNWLALYDEILCRQRMLVSW